MVTLILAMFKIIIIIIIMNSLALVIFCFCFFVSPCQNAQVYLPMTM